MRSSRSTAFADRLCDTTLAVIAGAHVLLAIALFIALVIVGGKAQAEAGSKTTCTGTNLIESYRTEKPDLLAAIKAEAARTVNGESRLWRIEKEGVDPSWLYGTMHVADPRVLDMPAPADVALKDANTVVIETDEIVDPVKAQAALLMNPELTMFTDGTTLETLLSDEQFETLKHGLHERGVSIALVSRMKPWMIAGLVALPECEAARQNQGATFLDKEIAVSALADGKVLKGLETIEEQLEAMASLPMDFHLQGLIETVSLGPLLDDINHTMTELYLTDRLGMIWPFLRAVAPESGSEVSYAEFEERLITARNHVMAERAEPILEKGNAFVAVGALHLPGEEGLVALLAEAGYKLTPVL